MQPLYGQGFMLRPFQHTDVASFVAAIRESASTMSAWMPWARADYNAAQALEWFAHCDANMANGTSHDIGVFAPDGDTLLGGIAINQIQQENNLGNLGYWIRQSRQRQGLASGAARVMAGYGFRQLGLTRLEIVAAEDNLASRAVALRIGAQFECIARNRLVLHGRPCAAAVYSLVPESFAEGTE